MATIPRAREMGSRSSSQPIIPAVTPRTENKSTNAPAKSFGMNKPSRPHPDFGRYSVKLHASRDRIATDCKK
jgi:hypothetical protein